MTISLIFTAVSIIVLAMIALLFFFAIKDKSEKKLSSLAGLAFGFILAGIMFGENRILGYSLLGIGVILSVMDIFKFVRSR